MAMAPESTKALPSQENLLLDYVERLEKHKNDRNVVHVHLSRLRPFNRREHHIRAATSTFEPLIADLNGQLFTLRNADLFFAFKRDVQPQVETLVQKIKFLFSDDPLIAEEDDASKSFADWYICADEYDDVLSLAQSMVDEEEERKSRMRSRMDARAALKAKQKQGEPLTPEVLARIEDALSRADLSNFVRRQFICRVDSKMIPEQRFSELYISISDLRETLMPGVNLASNRWLFHHLTETLDRRMLVMLSKTDAITITGEISINANVKTLLTDEFQAYDDNMSASRRGAMVIELQKEDIFADLSGFLFARDFAQERGYRLLLDGVTLPNIFVVDREKLGCDFLKLIWSPAIVDAGDEVHDRIREISAQGNGEKIILSRCDTRESVDVGRSLGVQLFQGRYVENLIAEDARRRELLKLKHRIQRSAELPDDGAQDDSFLP